MNDIPSGDFYDTTPTPLILPSMKAQRWTVSGALAELVDNSFGPGRGDASITHITYDTKAKVISVLDNGRGMSAIGRLFQLGSAPVRAPGDIGNYGYGGSFAVLWLARKVEVFTLAKGQVQYDTVDWDKVIASKTFPLLSNSWEPATVTNTPAELLDTEHGTLIRLHLARERSVVTSNVQRDLAATYAPAARLGRQLIWATIGKNGETRNLGDAVVAFPAGASIPFSLTVELDNFELLPVTGEIGVVDGLSYERSQIAIGFGPRVILKTKDCFVSPDGERRYSGAGVTGWLDLGEGWQPYLNTTKDGINNDQIWSSLMGYVFEKIEPLLKRVEDEKFEIEFESLAMTLEQQLGGLARVKVLGKSERREGEDIGQGRQGTDATGNGSSHPKSAPTGTPGEDVEAPKATSRVLIVPQTDAEMEGLLVTAESVSDGVQVAVNKEHPVMMTALISRPVNRQMLNVAMTREMAALISHDESLLQRLFTRPRQEELKEFSEDKKQRLIHRLLLDDVKS